MEIRPVDANKLLERHRKKKAGPANMRYTEGFNDCLMRVRSMIHSAPTLTPPNEPERAGLHGKYTVHKNKDGSLVTDCFVLRPAKDTAAVAALRAYAAATDNAELSADIINWVGTEPNEPLTIEQLRQMTGEPVWCSCKPIEGGDGYWCLCQRGNIITPAGSIFDVKEIPRWVFYRRPPEGDEDT